MYTQTVKHTQKNITLTTVFGSAAIIVLVLATGPLRQAGLAPLSALAFVMIIAAMYMILTRAFTSYRYVCKGGMLRLEKRMGDKTKLAAELEIGAFELCPPGTYAKGPKERFTCHSPKTAHVITYSRPDGSPAAILFHPDGALLASIEKTALNQNTASKET